MRNIVVIAHNLRSTHNVGSLLRTADGLGVTKVYMSGYTPYPKQKNDTRLPHIAQKVHKQIAKTALGAEDSVKNTYQEDIVSLITELKNAGYSIVALEQSASSIDLQSFQPVDKLVLIIGREVEGIEPEVLKMCDKIVEIPMLGKKESLNVVQAAAIALYHCQYYPLA